MTSPFTPRALGAGLSLAVTLAMSTALSGCGGSGQNAGEAVVVTEPGVILPTPGAAAAPTTLAPTAAPTAASPAAPATAKVEGWGTLKGQIVFGGTPPPPENLIDPGKAPKDPEVCAKDKPILSERLQVDGATKGVKNVLVYLPKPTAVNEEAKSAAAKTEVTFDQNKCVFEPHVLGVMVGSKILLKSSDPVNHNVNAKLKNSPFNSLLAAGQSSPFPASIGERSPAQVTCDIHPWMLAWWLVLDNPYFAVTDANGNFEIKNVPAGTQKVVVWQEATGFITPQSGEDVTIAANETTAKPYTIDPAKVKPSK